MYHQPLTKKEKDFLTNTIPKTRLPKIRKSGEIEIAVNRWKFETQATSNLDP